MLGMSRHDKKYHQENVLGTAQDQSVRLFAFSNSRAGYQVCFSPEAPIFILKTKKSKTTQQHPCKQWESFSALVFDAAPNTTHAVYLADTSTLDGPQYEQEELINGAAVGPLLKRLSNVITKLNPHNSTLVAAGVSALLALKYVLVGEKQLGHRDRLIGRAVLVLPSLLEDCKNLVQEVLRMRDLKPDAYPLPELVVLVADASTASDWTKWLSTVQVEGPLFAAWSVITDLEPSLFAAVARHAGVVADGTEVDLATRFLTPRVYRIDFVLSSQTKSVEQVVQPCDLDPSNHDKVDKHLTASFGCGHDADTAVATVEDTENDAKNKWEDDSEKGESLFFGLSGLQHLTGSVKLLVEGRIMDLARGIVGSIEGQVVVEGLESCMRETAPDLLKRVKSTREKGVAVELTASLVRDKVGRTYLHPRTLRALTVNEIQSSFTVGDSVDSLPPYNISNIAYNYGGILIRGRKCALIRNLSDTNHPDRMFFPYTPASSSETATECAIRAVCEGCDVSCDNFYVPSWIPPVIYYKQEDELLRCIALYIMFATDPSPQGIDGDRFEDAPDPEEPYDWTSYDRARTLLSSEAEREALMEAKGLLRKAAMVGMYQHFPNYGFFGDSTDDT
ncbi:unnamed protein product [Phytomonas sp. EM1]|nr:unnamed protein product [Phytomonas sp. EM1]|eukprot:CCW60372.1 unnamed protein product [Phytomonas sp. isolate EM1]